MSLETKQHGFAILVVVIGLVCAAALEGCAELAAALAHSDHHSTIVGQQRAADAATMNQQWQIQQQQNQEQTRRQNQQWGR